MLQLLYTTEQLATVAAVPVVTVVLLWTLAVFHRNRHRWAVHDIPVVAVLISGVVRNLTVLTYTLVSLREAELCGVIVWLFNSVHTFQASCLTTLAVVGMFAAKLRRKGRKLKQFLTSAHVVYHLFCLTTLCACVGVAAILAQRDQKSGCRFMPFQLDVKFNVFVVVLHIFLAIVSVACFLVICYHTYRTKMAAFDYVKKSVSDLSDLSLGMSATYARKRNYCDNSDISTTVSSTNSRRPWLVADGKMAVEEEEKSGLGTINPVLIVCYFFYHLPLIALCIFPRSVAPFPVSGVAMWLGLLQDLLLPAGMGVSDSRFADWVGRLYRCGERRGRRRPDDKPPQVGIIGKFRPFDTPDALHRPQQPTTERRHFPITNGSLYTSIDGRLPVVHNYRRQRQPREPQSLTMGIHATHLRQNCDFHRQFEKSPSNQDEFLLAREGPLRTSKSAEGLDDVRARLSLFQSQETTSEDETVSFCSITTDANCDFEFFQTRDAPLFEATRRQHSRCSSRASIFEEAGLNFRIRRSNSKRSLENFHAYLDETGGGAMQRASSVAVLSGGVKRAGYYGGSAPDIRKVFVSEYI